MIGRGGGIFRDPSPSICRELILNERIYYTIDHHTKINTIAILYMYKIKQKQMLLYIQYRPLNPPIPPYTLLHSTPLHFTLLYCTLL